MKPTMHRIRYYKDKNGIGFSMKPGMIGPESGGLIPWKTEVKERPTEFSYVSKDEYERLGELCDKQAAIYFD